MTNLRTISLLSTITWYSRPGDSFCWKCESPGYDDTVYFVFCITWPKWWLKNVTSLNDCQFFPNYQHYNTIHWFVSLNFFEQNVKYLPPSNLVAWKICTLNLNLTSFHSDYTVCASSLVWCATGWLLCCADTATVRNVSMTRSSLLGHV